MQFLWKYIDDLIGKGLETNLIFELLLYASCTLVPIGLPLAVLLSSIMIMGNLSEKSEYTAIKSSGISYFETIKPILLCSICISFFSFIFSDKIIPYANLKNTNLMYDIIHKKLAFSLEEGVFFNEINGYSLKVEKKIDDNNFKDIIILDHSDKKVKKTFLATEANIKMSMDEDYLNVNLINGVSYSENSCFDEDKKNCITTTKFDLFNLKLDLSSFKFNRGSTDRFNNKAKTMNINQLKNVIDSVNQNMEKQKKEFNKERKSVLVKSNNTKPIKKNIKNDKIIIAKKTKNNLKNNLNRIQYINRDIERKNKYLNKLKVELNKKYTYSIACIIMFLIGAPLGGIIKKGGFGLPVVISIILFISYHIISITGEKLVKKNVVDTLFGIWGPTILFFMLGILLTYKMQKERI